MIGRRSLRTLAVVSALPSTRPRSCSAIAILAGILLWAQAPSTNAIPRPLSSVPPLGVVIYIQPLGDGLSSEDIDATARALVAELGADVRILAPRPLPQSAYYPARKRYRAEKLLDFIEPLLPPDGDRILALTTRDVSSTSGSTADWGLVGLASYTRPVGIVSKFRCQSGAASPARARERLAKIAVHEIGHTLGLRHCDVAGCLMQDARGKVSICEQMDGFCPRCRHQVETATLLATNSVESPRPER